jgi:hypothetical protein
MLVRRGLLLGPGLKLLRLVESHPLLEPIDEPGSGLQFLFRVVHWRLKWKLYLGHFVDCTTLSGARIQRKGMPQNRHLLGIWGSLRAVTKR